MNDPRMFDISTDAEAAFAAAADAVAAGEVIVLPTDTVYGVGADAFDPDAVTRLLQAKQRGRDMPPPVLVAEIDMVRSLVDRFDADAMAIAQAFWPGALTIIATAAAHLQLDLGDRGNTIAFRVPDHDFTRELLRRTGPLAVSSANISGRDAALSIADAREQLGDTIAVYLDAGVASGPVPSTILDLTGERPCVLREGRITAAALNEVVPGLVRDDATEEPEPSEQGSAPEQSVTDAAPFGLERDD